MTQTMVGFGFKQAWLAVRDGDPAAVRTALGLGDLGPVPWRSGVDLAYLTDDRLVLTPLLPDGRGGRWLLVAGRWLLGPATKVDVAGLSAELGTEVQFFQTHRVLELHRWERAVDGETRRRFAYLGESGDVLDWLGVPDPVERLPELYDEEATVLVDEHDVMRVAGAWSVDPTSLDGKAAPGPLTAATAP